MSQKARKKRAKTKKVSYAKKNWYEVQAPKSFNFKNIGEVIGLESTIEGRVIENLLFDFTNDYSDINLKLKFKITNINPEAMKCNSIFIGHSYTSDFIRSLIGRGSTKIQTIINVTTKDNYKFRTTMICTTIKRARSSQQILIRKIMDEILKEFAGNLNHEKFITGLIYHEIENQIARVAKTIYPLSSAVIIKSKLISIPEGGEDKVFISKEEEFEIVEIPIKRSRKSEIRRTERINVKKLQSKSKLAKEEEEEEKITPDEKEEEEE
jgi:small subunit ribosomal protein S3Ae